MTTLKLQNTLREIVIDSANLVEKIDGADSSIDDAKTNCSEAESFADDAVTAAQEASSYAQEAWSLVDSIEDELSDLRQQVEDLQTSVCEINNNVDIKTFETVTDENEQLRLKLRNIVEFVLAEIGPELEHDIRSASHLSAIVASEAKKENEANGSDTSEANEAS